VIVSVRVDPLRELDEVLDESVARLQLFVATPLPETIPA